MNFLLTDSGSRLYARVNAGMPLQVTKIKAGAGYSTNPQALQDVLDVKQIIDTADIQINGAQTKITVVVSNAQLSAEYQLRQIGLYAMDDTGEERLFLIGQSSSGDPIPARETGIVEYTYDIYLKFSNTPDVTIDVGTGNYISRYEYQQHTNDENNPHKVTARQVGLEKVPNVTTNDQTPTYDTAESRNNLTSGEKLSDAFGKIRKYFLDLKTVAFSGSYNDLSNRPSIPEIPESLKNPHPWKANGKTYDGSSAQDMGTLGIGYGGTGATTAEEARTALGLGEAAVNGVANNDTTTAAGYLADARIVKTHGDEIDQINSNLRFPDGAGFYPDCQDGVRGYNTDVARGADTFIPFKAGVIDLGVISLTIVSRRIATFDVKAYVDNYASLSIHNFLFQYIQGTVYSGDRSWVDYIYNYTYNPSTGIVQISGSANTGDGGLWLESKGICKFRVVIIP